MENREKILGRNYIFKSSIPLYIKMKLYNVIKDCNILPSYNNEYILDYIYNLIIELNKPNLSNYYRNLYENKIISLIIGFEWIRETIYLKNILKKLKHFDNRSIEKSFEIINYFYKNFLYFI